MPEAPRSDLHSRVGFSAVVTADFDEMAELRIAAMRASLEHVGRFEPTRARDRLQKSFFPEHSQFILLDGNKVSFYTFRRTDDGFRLDHLYIHPSHQSQGVGSLVLQTLIAQADAQRQIVHVGALKESSANHFYARHGFHPQTQDAWDIYYIRPAAAHGKNLR